MESQSPIEASAFFQSAYDELRRLARRQLRSTSPITLQTTDLIHEAFLRLQRREDIGLDYSDFVALACVAMRHVVVDHIRRRTAAKRGGNAVPITLNTLPGDADFGDLELMALDAALNELAALDARQARIVELRFFGGLNIDETATVLRVSEATVTKEWRKARAWLKLKLSAE